MRRKIFLISMIQILIILVSNMYGLAEGVTLGTAAVIALLICMNRVYITEIMMAIMACMIILTCLSIWNNKALDLSCEKWLGAPGASGVIESISMKHSDDYEEMGNRNCCYRLKVVVDGKGVRKVSCLVTYYGRDDEALEIGDVIYWKGRLDRPKPATNPGGFDYNQYLKGRGIRMISTAKSLDTIGASRNLYRRLNQHIHRINSNFFSGYGDRKVPSIVRGIVIGDKSEISTSVYDDFRRNGTAHVLAVSGLHVGVILAVFRLLYGRRKIRKSMLACLVLLILYGFLTGWSTSVTRAVIMGCIWVLSIVTKSEYDLLTGVGLTSIIVLIMNPNQLFTVGYQMSYLAVLGIAFFSPVLKSYLPTGIAIYLSVQLPLSIYMAYQFNYISFMGIVMNVPTVFITAIMVTLGIVSILLSEVGLSTGLIDNIIWGFGKSLLYINGLTRHIEREYDQLFQVTSPLSAVVIMMICIPMVLASEWMYVMFHRRRFPIIVLTLSLCIALAFVFSSKEQRDFRSSSAVMIDVNQGDSMCFQSRKGTCIMVDGGGNRKYNIALKVLKPYLLHTGIGKLDMCCITHFDMDHAKGLKELREIFTIDRYIEPTTTCDLAKGDGIRIDVLWPTDKLKGEPGVDNDHSSVYRVEVDGLSILVTGDISMETEKAIVNTYKGSNLLKCDVLKVAHHGSKYSTCEEFLQAVSPKVAIIGVGKNNYGHPSPGIIDKLNKHGIIVFRTDEDGAIGVRKESERIEVCTMLRGKKAIETS